MLRADSEYVSAGCSRTPQALDWGAGGRICYGSGHALVLVEPSGGQEGSDTESRLQVTHTLHRHTNDVITCRWLRYCSPPASSPAELPPDTSAPAEELVITGSRDRSAIVWSATSLAPASHLTGHTSAVELVDGAVWDCLGVRRVTCVTAAADSTVRVWSGPTAQEVVHQQTVSLGRSLALSLRLVLPPGAAAPWILTGTDDNAVRVLTTDASGVYSPALTLSGHTDWVRCVDDVIVTDDVAGSQLLVATAGQDATIRVWRMTASERNSGPPADVCGDGEVVGDAGSKSSADIIENGARGSCEGVGEPSADNPGASGEPASAELRLRSQTITVPARSGQPLTYSVTLDSVLSGHENWVCGLRWRPRSGAAPHIASASMDRSLLIWTPVDGAYVETVRLGAVGGNTLGLLGCAWRPDGHAVLAHGHGGAVHLWYQTPPPGEEHAAGSDAGVESELEQEPPLWQPGAPFGGHVSAVCDLTWAPSGGYLLTCGADQTTRLHARTRAGGWHQMGRPQVHGHDMSCVAALSDCLFASGSEEKVARAFAMPSAVRDTLSQLCGVEITATGGDGGNLPEGAAVPSLGLTNKPVFSGGSQASLPRGREESAEAYFQRPHLTAPPTEETLLQNTLWPEMRKLYGHGFELHTMAASHDGRLLATACRAAKPEHAAILLWDTASWRQTGQLTGAHQLTVVQLAFSPDDEYLLAVSRDRTWSLWQRAGAETSTSDSQQDQTQGDTSEDEEEPSAPASRYQLHQRGVKAHGRIIWCCAWLPSGLGFLTGSRDGTLVLWRRSEAGDTAWSRAGEPYKPGSAVTAVAATEGDLLAVGLESGGIRLVTIGEGDRWVDRLGLDTCAAHHGAVRRLQFRPGHQGGATGQLLASCSVDGAVKLHRIEKA